MQRQKLFHQQEAVGGEAVKRARIRGFICTNVNPEGLRDRVNADLLHAAALPHHLTGKRVLVIGAGMGYGLALRTALVAQDAPTVGVMYEREPSEKRDGTAGYHNDKALEAYAKGRGVAFETINADAFAPETKATVLDTVRRVMGGVDLLLYSLAAPVRTVDGVTYRSVLKPIGQPVTRKTVDIQSGKVYDIELQPATDDELEATIKVMGGEDLSLWMKSLDEAGLLAHGAGVVTLGYIGPELTHAIYRDGTIGQAKAHMQRTIDGINDTYAQQGVRAAMAVCKAIVTQSSAAIPVVPLYIAALYKVMKQMDMHEVAIHQATRLLNMLPLSSNIIRLDDYELLPYVQQHVTQLYHMATTENIEELTDVAGYRKDFAGLFGFEA